MPPTNQQPSRPDRPVKYLHQDLKVVRGFEARKIAELERNGWELISQDQGKLRTELRFRKVKPDSPWTKILSFLGALSPANKRRLAIATGVAALVIAIGIAVAVSGGSGDDTRPAAGQEKSDSATPDVGSESASPSPSVTPLESSSPSQSTTPTPPPEPDVITAQNTSEFAALLTGDSCSSKIAKFAKAHEGDEIAFDGSVANIAQHGSYNTRFDYLLGPGDDGPNTSRGPAFQYRDVSYYDFNLVGKKQPDSLDVGDLFRFTATVESYENGSCLLLLSPVETEVR